MSDSQRLVFSILEFLDSEVKSGSLSDNGVESLEVVIECLERVYNLSLSSPSDVSKFHFEKPLKAIFENARKGTSKSPTDDNKAEAERLKVQGNELMNKGRFTEAIGSYTRATEYDWTNAVYLCNRAAAYSKLGQHEEAVKDCKEALTLDPKYGKAYGRMGAAYMALEKYKDARECFNKAIELDPTIELYHNNLRTVENKLRESTESSSSQATGNLGGANLLNSLFSNPGIMNMAQQFMTNPQMQQMVTNMMGGFGGTQSGTQPSPETSNPSGTTDQGSSATPSDTAPGDTNPESTATAGTAGYSSIFQFATQMAEQLEQTNPDLVNSLRNTMQHMAGNTDNSSESPDEEKK